MLTQAKKLRASWQITTLAATGIAGVLKLATNDKWPADLHGASTATQIIFLGLAFVSAVLVLLTDRSALTVIGEAESALEERNAARDQLDLANAFGAQLQAGVQRAAVLDATTGAMRALVDVAITHSPRDLETDLTSLLDLLACQKQTLFAMGDEEWNFAVYLYDKASNLLVCKACRRPSQSDQDAVHRSWHPSEGHIGHCFHQKRDIIVSDSTDANVRGYFEAPENKANPRDNTKYRSLAAVPLMLGGSNEAFGVVVATSDIPGRFQPDTADAGEHEAVKPVRALARTLATYLAVTTLHVGGKSDAK